MVENRQLRVKRRQSPEGNVQERCMTAVLKMSDGASKEWQGRGKFKPFTERITVVQTCGRKDNGS